MGKFDSVEAAFGLAGSYRIEAPIGSGGMGAVYRAIQLGLDRPVALKVLHQSSAWQSSATERFQAEARLAARVSHANVVRVLATGEGPSGMYIVYEFVEGQSLRARMAAGLSIPEAAGYAIQVCQALEAIHLAGIVHRDIKPENLLIDREGVLKMTDLGLARDLAAPGIKTQTGLVFGTPNYMSPEQCHGKRAGPAADIYSLGVVLYEMLTRSRPFRDDSPATLILDHVRTPPDRPSVRSGLVPRVWDAVVLDALAKRPKDRYPSAAAFAASIRDAQAGRPSRAPKTTRRMVAAVRSASVPVTVGVIGVLLAGVVLWQRAAAPAGPPSPLTPPPATTNSVTASVRSDIDRPAKPPPPERAENLVRLAALEERVVAARLERHRPAAGGPSQPPAIRAEAILVDAQTLRSPVLEVSLHAGSPATAAPLVTIETAPAPVSRSADWASTRSARTAANATAPLSRSALPPTGVSTAWTLPLDAAQLCDGTNAFRIELPGVANPIDRIASVRVRVARAADFPAVSLERVRRRSDPGCSELRKKLDEVYAEYDALRIGYVLLETRALTAAHPGCGEPILLLGWIHLRFLEERRGRRGTSPSAAADAADIVVGAFTGADELGNLEDWQLWRIGCGAYDRAVRQLPGWYRGWMEYGRWLIALGEPETAARLLGWAAQLDPRSGDAWALLAMAEADQLERVPRSRRGPEWRQGMERALLYAQRSTQDPAAEHRFWDAAPLALGRILVRLNRPDEARPPLRSIIAQSPGHSQAWRLLESIGDRPPPRR